MTYLIIGLILITGLIIYLISNNGKLSNDNQTQQLPLDTVQRQKVDPNNNPYKDLRNLALGATMEQIGVNFQTNQTKIYGVIMDWDLGDGTATLISFLSGDASLYLSSGGGMIGGSGHQNIKNTAIAFIDKANGYLELTSKADSTPLPEKSCIKFYFLTNNGIFVGQEQMINIENSSSKWIDLFEEGNKVISEIRIVTEDKL